MIHFDFSVYNCLLSDIGNQEWAVVPRQCRGPGPVPRIKAVGQSGPGQIFVGLSLPVPRPSL